MSALLTPEGGALARALCLARISLAFGRVDRATRHEDGARPETDTDHTVMLGLVACELAPAGLDRAKVAAFALVHDLAEVYAGDTQTLVISAEGMAAKRAREDAEGMLGSARLTDYWENRRFFGVDDGALVTFRTIFANASRVWHDLGQLPAPAQAHSSLSTAPLETGVGGPEAFAAVLSAEPPAEPIAPLGPRVDLRRTPPAPGPVVHVI